MKTLMTRLAMFVAVLSLVQPARAAAETCKKVSGQATWTLVPSPNDAFGRIVGPSTGTLTAAITAYITSLTGGANGALVAKSVEIWVLGPQDLLVFDGQATFTPIAGDAPGTVYDSLTLKVTSGTGAYENATGTLNVTGTGFNIFGPAAGPGSSFFAVTYKGSICVP